MWVHPRSVGVLAGELVFGEAQCASVTGASRCWRDLDVSNELRRWWIVNEDAAQAQAEQQEQEWLRQDNLVYVGLIGIGTILVQPFLTAASLDLSAKTCVVAFSVTIPLLAALVMVNRQEAFRRRRTPSVLVAIARSVAQAGAFVGVVAGFWHILWIAGVGMLAGGLVGMAAHSAGYWRLERTAGPTSQKAEESGDSDS